MKEIKSYLFILIAIIIGIIISRLLLVVSCCQTSNPVHIGSCYNVRKLTARRKFQILHVGRRSEYGPVNLVQFPFTLNICRLIEERELIFS